MPEINLMELEGGGWAGDLGSEVGRGDPVRGPKPTQNFKKLTTAGAMLGLLYTMGHFTRPLLKATATQHKPWLLRLIDWTLDRFKSVIDSGANYVQHHLSKGALHAQPELGQTLHWLADEADALYADVATLAHTTALGFGRVAHHAIPKALHREIVPIKRQQRKLRVGLITTAHDVESIRRFNNENVPRHGKQRMNKLEHRLYHHDEPILGRTANLAKKARTEAHRARDEAHRAHWTWAFAGAVPAFLYALRRLKLQTLLCRNNKEFSSELCASAPGRGQRWGRYMRRLHGGWLDVLLAGTALLSPFSLQDFARECVVAADFFTESLAALLNELSLGGPDYLGASSGPIPSTFADYLD